MRILTVGIQVTLRRLEHARLRARRRFAPAPTIHPLTRSPIAQPIVDASLRCEYSKWRRHTFGGDPSRLEARIRYLLKGSRRCVAGLCIMCSSHGFRCAYSAERSQVPRARVFGHANVASRRDSPPQLHGSPPRAIHLPASHCGALRGNLGLGVSKRDRPQKGRESHLSMFGGVAL